MMNLAQREVAARRLCVLRGRDPDECNPDDIDTLSVYPTRKNWENVLQEIMEFEQVQEAIDSAKPRRRS